MASPFDQLIQGLVPPLNAAPPVTQPGVVFGYDPPTTREGPNGDAIAQFLPGTVNESRITTVLIPPHIQDTQNGLNVSYDPNNPPHRKVVLDPHMGGEAVIVDLSNIDRDAVRRAAQAGREALRPYVAAGKINQIDAARMATANALRTSGALVPAVPVTPPGETNAVAPFVPASQPAPPQPAMPAAPGGVPVPPRAGILSHFGAVAPAAAARPQAAGVGVDAAPPRIVEFDIPTFGTHEEPYHEVFANEEVFVVAYDENRPGSRYFPARGSDVHAVIGAQIRGDNYLYVLMAVPMQFRVANYRVCLFLVSQRQNVPNV